jgi:hypothetical protein
VSKQYGESGGLTPGLKLAEKEKRRSGAFFVYNRRSMTFGL